MSHYENARKQTNDALRVPNYAANTVTWREPTTAEILHLLDALHADLEEWRNENRRP